MESTAPSGDGARILERTWTELERLRSPRMRTAAAAARSATELLGCSSSTMLRTCSLIVLENLPLVGSLDRELISVLIAGAACPVVATCEYAAQLPQAPAMQSYSAIRSLAKWREQNCERCSDPLEGAGARLFGITTEPRTFPASRLRITRLEAAGETGEIRLAARVVMRHLRDTEPDRKIDPSDILVIARGARYRRLIDEIFTEFGIGVRVATTQSVADSALGSVLLELLQMAADATGGTRDQALLLLRMPHLDVGTRAADKLERLVVTRGYLGLDGWDALSESLGVRTVNRVNRLRRAIGAARSSLAVAETNEEIARSVRKLAKDLRLVGNAYFARRRIVERGSGDPLAASLAEMSVLEDNHAWEIVERILDHTMPELLRVSVSSGTSARGSFAISWLALFTRALGAESLRSAHESTDLVRVTGTSAGDGQAARVTIILGLQQKVFPRQPRQNPFLRDAARALLARRGIELPASQDTADREREAFARAVATASDALYLSYPATDTEGKSTVPSFFIEDLQRAVGTEHRFGIERLGVADVVPEPEDSGSRAELLAAIAHGVWQRLPATAAADANRTASFSAWNDLLATTTTGVPISSGRGAMAHPTFNPTVFTSSPHNTLELSASQLATIHHCTYQHFVQKVLRPADISIPEYDSLTKGSLVHEAMLRWVKMDGWHRGDAALGELDAWFVARAERLSPSVRNSALSQHNIDTDRERLREFVRGELDMINSSGAAQPAYNELAFGERVARHGDRDPASLPATFDLEVQTSTGERTVKFTGSIDRVDVYSNDQVTYGIALDYKTGRTSDRYAKAMLDGTDLQLRLYLLALDRLWDIKPAGALYVGFGDGIRRGAVCEDAAHRIGEFDSRHVTVMSTAEWNTFIHADTESLIQPLIERLVTFDIVASPYKDDCGLCALEVVCRYSQNESMLTNE
jgi:ATP-dependent helicase/nuclease subunit B